MDEDERYLDQVFSDEPEFQPFKHQELASEQLRDERGFRVSGCFKALPSLGSDEL